jgi:hypothetical protein
MDPTGQEGRIESAFYEVPQSNEVKAELREEFMTRSPSAVELVSFMNQLCVRER